MISTMKGLVMIIVARSTSVPKGDKHPTITTKTPPTWYAMCVVQVALTTKKNERDVDKTTAEATTNNN